MVTQNEEMVQAPPPESGPGVEPEPQNPILAEIETLNNSPDVEIPAVEEVAPAAESDSQPVPEAQVGQPAPAPEPAPAPAPEPAPAPAPGVPQSPQYAPEQIQQMQRQAAEYEQLRQRAAIQNESQRYQQQLESQGMESELAQQSTQQYMQSKQAQQDLLKRGQEYGDEILGKVAASEHFAQKYALQMSDLGALRQAENPEVMEELAKTMANDRKMRTELEQLRKAQVPAQQFDSSQGEPQVASNDSGLIDRYNAGDRSPGPVAAAKRVTGLG